MMQEQYGMCEQMSAGEPMEQMRRALHDLCQPLTTLQCRLELAGLVGSEEAYREAVELGLEECVRLVDIVHSMREILKGNLQVEKSAPGRNGSSEV